MPEVLSPVSLKRADKWVMALIGLFVLGLGGAALYYLLPILIALATNAIIFMAELAVLGILGIILLDRGTWTALFYRWKLMSRNMRKSVAREDPVGVLDVVVQKFETKLAKIDDNITQAVGAKNRQVDSIGKAEKKAEQEYGLAEVARRNRRSDAEVGQHAAAGSRWAKAAEELRPMAVLLTDLQARLEGARDLCAVQITDAKSQKDVLALKLGALQSGQKAVKSFKRFFGNNPELEMQEFAIDAIEQQASEAEAEIDQFMRVIDPMIQEQDLKKQAATLSAMKKFDHFLAARPAAVIEAVPALLPKETVR